jgi:hypothetical protein
MAGYQPLYVRAYEAGLTTDRQNFILPNDAYPTLENAYIWREKIIKKQGTILLGRLQRSVSASGVNILNLLTPYESTATIVPGSVSLAGSGGNTWTDPLGNGILNSTSGANGTINYVTGAFSGPGLPLQAGSTFQYYPGLPVMGLRTWEQPNSTIDVTIAFDQKYAYMFVGGIWQEWQPGYTWNLKGEPTTTDPASATVAFFWTTNYWQGPVTTTTPTINTKNKLLWITNNTGQWGALLDPIRVTDGTSMVNFAPQLDTGPTYLFQCLAILPFRGRLLVFNTWEGASNTTLVQYPQRIRWSTIGNPFIPFSAGPPTTGSWRDDVRGQGGFLDIPTSEDIVSVGFVRDNLVIYCERSTWQLRYTGRSIQPFQIEKVNSELGAEGTFSAVQFDTSLVGVGDKGIVECDSFKSQRIDIKIVDFVYTIQQATVGPQRVYGIRDFESKLAYWSYPLATSMRIFPDKRLVYNYENLSWATFDDSFTVYGTFQAGSNRTWLNTKIPWIECYFTWKQQILGNPSIIAGNQQGFVSYVDSQTLNDISLFIDSITSYGVGVAPTKFVSPNNNLLTGDIVMISNIPTATPFANYNGGIYSVIALDANTFTLNSYSTSTLQFSIAQTDAVQTYIGGGTIAVRDNFNVTSKKFNFLDEGQSIQLGYMDVLMDSTGQDNPGAISMNVYLDYNDSSPSNTLQDNAISGTSPAIPDTFFNSVIPTTTSSLNTKGGSKFWQRVYCPTRANFLTIQFTFSNAQMAGVESAEDVQIDSQVIWARPAGRLTQI